jgi:hypothetical protein
MGYDLLPAFPGVVIRLPKWFVGYPLGCTPLIFLPDPHPRSITIQGRRGLGSSGFLGASSLHRLLSTF